MKAKTDAAQRVAEAMKPIAARVAARVAPEEPEEDLLLDAGNEQEVGDSLTVWHQDPVTRGQLSRMRKTYLQRVKELFATALASTDPRICSLGGQINGLRVGMAALGHKEAKS